MLELLKPIDFEIEERGGLFESYFAPLGIHGGGVTVSEAKQDALDMLESLYRVYVESNHPQSEDVIKFAERLKEYCRREK